MNRKLLALGFLLGCFAVLSSISILFLKGASGDLDENLGFSIALTLNCFHALLLLVLSSIKRKYTDQQLISIGWVFTLSTIVFSGTAYLGMMSEFGIMLFNTVGIIGGLGIIISWIALGKILYDIYAVRKN